MSILTESHKKQREHNRLFKQQEATRANTVVYDQSNKWDHQGDFRPNLGRQTLHNPSHSSSSKRPQSAESTRVIRYPNLDGVTCWRESGDSQLSSIDIEAEKKSYLHHYEEITQERRKNLRESYERKKRALARLEKEEESQLKQEEDEQLNQVIYHWKDRNDWAAFEDWKRQRRTKEASIKTEFQEDKIKSTWPKIHIFTAEEFEIFKSKESDLIKIKQVKLEREFQESKMDKSVPIALTISTVVEPFIITDINFNQTDESTLAQSSKLPSVPETMPSSSKSKGKQLKKIKSAALEKEKKKKPVSEKTKKKSEQLFNSSKETEVAIAALELMPKAVIVQTTEIMNI